MDYGIVMLFEDVFNIKVNLCLNLKMLGSFLCDMWCVFGFLELSRIKFMVFLKCLIFFL